MLPRVRPVAALVGSVLALGGPSLDRATGSVVLRPPAAAAQQPVPADVRFMRGMIDHHAQALLIGQWAPTHGASAEVRRLAERIVVSQRDEIELMRTWLADRGLAAPDSAPTATHAHGPGALMPGMLSAAQLAALDAARDAAFDTLFLTLMIQHHHGALTMVRELFASPGAGQDQALFGFASDVLADQTTEIARMRQLLVARRARRAGP